MIKFEFLVCAESLIKASETDTFSAINILEDYVAETYPTFIPKLSVLLITTREATDPQTVPVKFAISNNEEILFERDIPINFFDKFKTNFALNINTFAIKKPGKLTFKYSYGTEVIGYSINMKVRENPIATSNPPSA